MFFEKEEQMKLTSKQIREGIENAKKCPHLVVFYNCDDVGYPCGWVETWTCLVCGLYDYHSTGGNGQCLGEFGNRKFLKTRVIIEVNNWFCEHYSKDPYPTFDYFFKEIIKCWIRILRIVFTKPIIYFDNYSGF